MFKRVLIRILVIFGGLLIAIVAGWYIFCTYAASWRNIEPPPFHESWNSEQRADLLAIDNSLRNNAEIGGLSFFFIEEGFSPVTQWCRKHKWCAPATLLLGWRDLCMPARAALHETMRSGKGNVQLPSGIPVADFALKMHKNELLKELIRRGCNPNHTYISWLSPVEMTNGGETNLMIETFENLGLDFEKRRTADERLDLLNFMHRHGGKIDTVPNSKLAELYILLPMAEQESNDKGLSTAWALRHGFPTSDKTKQDCIFFMQKCNPELLQELRQEGLLPQYEDAATSLQDPVE